MEAKFVTHSSDQDGNRAIGILTGLGYQTEVLSDDSHAPDGTIALFTPLKPIMQGGGRYLRCAASRLTDGIAPLWAARTPFRVAVFRTERNGSTLGFEEALRTMARDYRIWNPDQGQLVPWAVYESDPKITPDSSCMITARQWLSRINLTIIVRSGQAQPERDESIQHMLVNDWRVNYTDEPVVFSDTAVADGLEFLSGWQQHFTKEGTWSQRELGTPSLIIRFDCVVRDGKLVVYEVEERPSGMGISSVVNPFFAKRLGEIAGTWPDFDVIISPLRGGTDDHIWLDSLNRRRQGTDLVLVRAEPEETEFHHHEPQSVSTLKAKGDKTYGERMGIWRRITDIGQLPWEESFVLKPIQGSKMKEVEIWDSQRRPGSSNRQRIEASFARNGEMFLQDMQDPLETGRAKYCWMIYRVFFGFNVLTSQWECLGGNWNARSNLRIHGASDALFGPVVME